MSDNRAKKGGDRKSIKYIASKNGSFLTDFFPKNDGKNVHLLGKEVVDMQDKIDMKMDELQLLKDNKKEMIGLRNKMALERCRKDDINPDWFSNPKSKEDMQLVLDWMNSKDSLLKVERDIKDVSTHLDEIRETHTKKSDLN